MDSEDEIEDLVDEIADLIKWEDAGIATDWSCYPFGHAKLVAIWRQAEKHIARMHNGRIQSFLLSWLKKAE